MKFLLCIPCYTRQNLYKLYEKDFLKTFSDLSDLLLYWSRRHSSYVKEKIVFFDKSHTLLTNFVGTRYEILLSLFLGQFRFTDTVHNNIKSQDLITSLNVKCLPVFLNNSLPDAGLVLTSRNS
jgi:hypothetical protein